MTYLTSEWHPNREQALDYICQKAVFMTDGLSGERLAEAFDTTLAKIGVEPTTADVLAVAPLSSFDPRYRNDRGSVRIMEGYAKRQAVFIYQVAAMLALHFGLYHDVDHAMQSPWHKPASECRFIACRAAIRLARHFGGQTAVDALRERNPFLEPRLIKEELYTGTGQKGPRLM